MNDNEWNYEWKWMKMPNERSCTFTNVRRKPLFHKEIHIEIQVDIDLKDTNSNFANNQLPIK